MPAAMPMLGPGKPAAMPMPRALEGWPTAPPMGLGCTAKMLWPRSRRTCFLLLASSAILRLRAAAVARSHATRSATSLTFLRHSHAHRPDRPTPAAQMCAPTDLHFAYGHWEGDFCCYRSRSPSREQMKCAYAHGRLFWARRTSWGGRPQRGRSAPGEGVCRRGIAPGPSRELPAPLSPTLSCRLCHPEPAGLSAAGKAHGVIIQI